MNNLIILTGPTAVGKSSLSIKLAKAINGEIVSADCMQVYKRMDIGTAKITPEEMNGIKHYLIDCIEPTDDFNVVAFKQMASEALKEIYNKNKIPIICGGTGFYIQALLYDIDFCDCQIDEKLRETLECYANENGNDALLELLKDIDPESAKIIPANNRKRVIRAIEYYRQTGQKISSHNLEQQQKKSPFNYLYFVLNDNRETLYNRIDKRVDKMISDGLVNEVTALQASGLSRGLTSMDGIGYKEILSYLNNEISLDDAIKKIKQNSRHYAKRQLTWFRREKDIFWLNKEILTNDDLLLNEILQAINTKGLLN